MAAVDPVARVRDDRRQQWRHPLQARVLVTPESGDTERFWALTRDVGWGGLFLLTDRSLPLGTVLKVKIVPREHAPVRLELEVVHHGRGLGLGCRLVGCSAVAARRLGRWLYGMPGATRAPKKARVLTSV